jgi:tetratricopeptide (TPR) repeat protein
MSGQPHRALPLFNEQNKLQELENNKEDITLALGLGNLAFMAEIHIGNLRSAELHLQQSIALCKEIGDDRYVFTMSLELGRLLTYYGAWEKSRKLFEEAEKNSANYGAKETNFGSMVYAYLTQLAFFMNRDLSLSTINYQILAVEHASHTMTLVNEHAKLRGPIERDFVMANWLLGAAYRLGDQFDHAEQYLSEALTRDRVINLVESEANILLDLARLRYDQKKYEEAKSLADEALLITERCGYVLQGADVNLVLAQDALEQEKDKAKAKAHAEEALNLAACDGPPYYYKVAYEEAERMLEKLK